MPELPEVETTRRGVAPWCRGEVVEALVVREPRLRWPVPPRLGQQLVGQRIEAIDRRGKYLLFRTAAGSLLVHLGMSGSLRVVDAGQLPAGTIISISACSPVPACATTTPGALVAFSGWSPGSRTRC